MKDLRASLRALSERGTPIGSRELRERVALELAGARLEPEHQGRRRLPGPVIAVAAAAVVIVAFGGVMMLLNWHKEEIAVTTTVVSPTTTVATETTVAPTTTAGTETTVPTPAVAPPPLTPLEPTPLDLQMTWEEVSPGSLAGAYLDSVVADGDRLVGVGAVANGEVWRFWTNMYDLLFSDAAAWVSEDGRAWSRIPDETGVFGAARRETRQYESSALADIAAWGGGFVGVGCEAVYFTPPDAAVWLSPDAVTWSRVADADAFSGGPRGETLVATNNRFVPWEDMSAVVAGGPGLVAVGEYDNQPAVWLSEDGVNWTRLDTTAIEQGSCRGNGRMTGVTVGGPGLVAIGWRHCDPETLSFVPFYPEVGERAAVWVSADGSAWEQTLLDPGVGGAANYSRATAVAAGAGGIAAVGTVGDVNTADGGRGTDHGFGAVWISEDGINWRLAAVLEHGDLLESDSFYYAASAGTALWQGDRLLVFGWARQMPSTLRPGGPAGHALVWVSPDQGQTWHLSTMQRAQTPTGTEGVNLWDDLMSDAAVFGEHLIVVGGSPHFGSGIVWLGEWTAG